jgi:hypothetical protein
MQKLLINTVSRQDNRADLDFANHMGIYITGNVITCKILWA